MTSAADVRSGRRAAALTASVSELENLSRFDRDDVDARAEQAVAAAEELRLRDLVLRGRLMQADLLRRRGNVAEAGRRTQEVQRRAVETGARHLQARTHFVLASVFQELGDLSLALEHAVRSVELLADDALPETRIAHLARLADCLGLSGDVAARECHDHVLGLAEAPGDVERQLLVLNNRAYCETVAGAFEEALVWSTRLQQLNQAHDAAMPVGRLDTVGRTLLELGRLDEAEIAMLPGERAEALDASLDGDAGADFLLTLAEARRRRGSLAQAQATLDECIRRCDGYGLTGIRVRARREQAELHPAREDFRAACAEHELYSDELMDLKSTGRDARALQAMYETDEARRQTRRYRELSLRDPLTGLYNRRHVDDPLPRLLARGAGIAGTVTVALLDLDHFERINDTWSHEVGDQVLRTVAGLLGDAGGAAGRGPPHRAGAPLGGADRRPAGDRQHRGGVRARPGRIRAGRGAEPGRRPPLPRQAAGSRPRRERPDRLLISRAPARPAGGGGGSGAGPAGASGRPGARSRPASPLAPPDRRRRTRGIRR